MVFEVLLATVLEPVTSALTIYTEARNPCTTQARCNVAILAQARLLAVVLMSTLLQRPLVQLGQAPHALIMCTPVFCRLLCSTR